VLFIFWQVFRIIPDNPASVHRQGPQELQARPFWYMAKPRTIPAPNGKIDLWHKSLKAEYIRSCTLLNIEQNRRLIAK
jgi:hypothetical protein